MKTCILIVLCACNPIVGVGDTVLHDAAPPDAPFTCPGDGMPLAFSPLLHGWLIADCQELTTDAAGTRALASCEKISEGPLEGPLEPAMIETTGALSFPRLAPDGQSAYIRVFVQQTGVYDIERFVRHPDGVWRSEAKLPLPEMNSSIASTIVNPGTGERMLYYQYSSDSFREWSSEGGTWQAVSAPYDASSFGLTSIDASIDFGFDGLRIVFLGQAANERPGVYYATRAHLADRFANAQRLAGVPYVQLPLLSADCARVYVYGLSRIFYLQQQ